MIPIPLNGGAALEQARLDAGLTRHDLWLRYFQLGGTSTPLQLEALLRGTLLPTAHDHDVVVQALNERFLELGQDHPISYADDL